MSDKETKHARYLCIHGHFYQPPRENPWLDFIEQQESAHPYHDWNERITRECYGPNSRSRLLGRESRIRELVNNYEFISFNFGPTLLAWLENFNPWLYSQIISADHASRRRHGGHGNAIAQVYNHIIMPLANRRDKLTQIRWGIEDFRYRYGRMPEGMWLAETAVDTETLELMAEEGIRFTILSPAQAKAVRDLTAGPSSTGTRREPPESRDSFTWKDVSNGGIDTTRPYRAFLGKDKQRYLDIFFYDSALSRGIAYEKLLASGSEFLRRIQEKSENINGLQGLINIATDGESYGHHFKFGEMALTWVIRNIENSADIKITNYGNYLESFPPEMEVAVIENSSWSCSHGIERWRSDCGCSTGGNAGWNQKWRSPLREGLDDLAADLALWFEDAGTKIFRDPWAARDDYIRVILNPSKENSLNFIRDHLKTGLDREDEVYALRLLESQRMSLYMFTSCGWFFDDISGLEPAQILMYASRAIELSKNSVEKKLEASLLKTLKKAKSNDPAYANGARIYHDVVKRSGMTSSRAAAHFAFHAVLGKEQEKTWYLNDIASPLSVKQFETSGSKGLTGVVEITERRTWGKNVHSFIVEEKDGLDPVCLIGAYPEVDTDSLMKKIKTLSKRAPETLTGRYRQRRFRDVKRYLLKDLIPDSRNLLTRESASALLLNVNEKLSSSGRIIKRLAYLMQHSNEPIPEMIYNLIHLHFIDRIEGLFKSAAKGNPAGLDELKDLLNMSPGPVADRAARDGYQWTKIDLMKEPGLKKTIHLSLHSQMKGIAESPHLYFLENLIGFISYFEKLGISPDLWECQNIFYDLLNNPEFTGGLSTEKTIRFRELGSLLFFNMEDK
ncbi:MAG: DUF3536 domain-containing protein [Deltaproteobacteria bacterium]|nr:DUF3536 domain-containing protein [Deltaproteobacteria bacterium]